MSETFYGVLDHLTAGYETLIPSTMEHKEEVHIWTRHMGSGTQRDHRQAEVRKWEKEEKVYGGRRVKKIWSKVGTKCTSSNTLQKVAFTSGLWSCKKNISLFQTEATVAREVPGETCRRPPCLLDRQAETTSEHLS